MKGLRSVGSKGDFKAAVFLPDDTAVLLFDQGDGVRLLKTDIGEQSVLGEVHLGATGDTGVALATNALDTICAAGTSGSGRLSGTSGAAFPAAADNTVNSFVACFDETLTVRFITFLGAGQTAASSLAMTGDAVFVGGTTYSTSLPISPGTLQPVAPSTQGGNGFVMRLSFEGTQVRYATYLGGPSGGSSITALAADAADNVYAVGSTSARDFPSLAALQPVMLSSSAGFVAGLSATGSNLRFSTFIAGAGLTGLALSRDGTTLLISGSIDPGTFPIAGTLLPVLGTAYQGLLRIAADGQTLQDSVLLFPGDTSMVSAGSRGDVWVTGTHSVPLPQAGAPGGVGEGVALHLDAADHLDTFLRSGGVAQNQWDALSLDTTLAGAAVSSDGTEVLLPGSVSVHAAARERGASAFYLPQLPPTGLLPQTVNDVLSTTCDVSESCDGTGGLLSLLTVPDGSSSLELSPGDLPLLTLQNVGLTPANGLNLSSPDLPFSSGCPLNLDPGASCGVLVGGSGVGTLVLRPENATVLSFPLAQPGGRVAPPITISEPELDFGVITGAQPVQRVLTLRNLSSADQTIASAAEQSPSGATYVLSEAGSSCAGPPLAHVIAAGSSCTLTLQMTASASSKGEIVDTGWQVGDRVVTVTGFVQALPLSISASRLSFGPMPTATSGRLPRVLYLSNVSSQPLSHMPVSSPSASPFQMTDQCPSILAAGSVCQIEVAYQGTGVNSYNSLSVALDQGLQVLLTGSGATIPTQAASGTTPRSLQLSAQRLDFQMPVVAGQVSVEIQTLRIMNSLSQAVPLGVTVRGDFKLSAACPAVLPAGATCSVALQFVPSMTGQRAGLLLISSQPSSKPVGIPLGGVGTPLLQPDPANGLDLGQPTIGEPVIRWFQVQAFAPNLSVSVSGTGFGVGLVQDANGAHGLLQPRQFQAAASAACFHCWIGVQFLPSALGSAEGNLLIQTGVDAPAYALPLHAWGLPASGLLLTPAQAVFASTPIGSLSAPATFTLTNAFDDAVVLALQPPSASADFQIVAGDGATACGSSLAPGSSCSVAVAFAPAEPGQRLGTVQLQTDHGTATAQLNGIGTASLGVSLRPANLDFSFATTGTLQVINTSDQPLTVGVPAASDPAYSVVSHCSALLPGAACAVDVSFQPSTAASSGAAFLSLPVEAVAPSGLPADRTFAVGLHADASSTDGSLTVFPTAADFGPAAVNQPASVRQFSVTNRSAQAYTLQFTGTQNFPLADPTACTALPAKATCTFSILFLPQAAGFLNGTIEITARDSCGGTRTTSVAVQGYGVATGSLTLSAGSTDLPLDFGQAPSGIAISRSLTLTNTGTSIIHLRRLAVTTPFHAESDCEVSLSPGSTCDLHLTYAPVLGALNGASSQTPRTDAGTLTVQSDAQSSPDMIYMLGGVQPNPTLGATVPETLPTLALSATSFTFPATGVGGSSPVQDLVVTNSGSVDAVVEEVSSATDFQASSECTLLHPGEQCLVHLQFVPDATTNATIRSGALRIRSNAAVSLEYLTLVGAVSPNALRLSASELTFAPSSITSMGSTAQLTLTNTTALPIAFSAFLVEGPFSLNAGTCPAAGGTLAAGLSCTSTLTFHPLMAGAAAGQLTISSPGLFSPTVVPLNGIGLAGRLQISAQQIDFGSVTSGATVSRMLTLTNVGDADLPGLQFTLDQLDVPVRLESSCPTGALPPGGSCLVSLTYQPTQAASMHANLAVSTSAPATSSSIALTGTATSALSPGILLTVNGGPEATLSVPSGAAARFGLSLTPQQGFRDKVTLTCQSLRPAPNANCALSGTEMNLLNDSAVTGAVVIATQSGFASAFLAPLAWALYVPLRRRKRGLGSASAANLPAKALFAGMALAALCGCSNRPGEERLPYTPPGTYHYQITATADSDPSITSAVQITVSVR